MKKLTAIISLAFILTSCFGTTKNENTNEKLQIKTWTVEEITNTWEIATRGTWSNTTSSWISDKETEDTLKEIDQIIEDVSNEK